MVNGMREGDIMKKWLQTSQAVEWFCRLIAKEKEEFTTDKRVEELINKNIKKTEVLKDD